MIQSVAGLVLRNEKVFLARRKAQGQMGGRWELPGGKQEAGEGPRAALLREFKEEFGVRIRVGAFCAGTKFVHSGREHFVRAYRVDLVDEIERLNDHDECAWFSIPTLPLAGEIVDSDRRLLGKFFSLTI